MFEDEENGSRRERGSLLSFGHGSAGAAPARAAAPASRHSEDALTLHRLARARREARSVEPTRVEPRRAQTREAFKSGAGAAHADRPIASEQASADAQPGLAGRLKSLLPSWRDRSRADVAEPPASRPLRAAEPEGEAAWQPAMLADRRFDERDPTESSDGETWTPLIDPLKVIGRVFDSKLLIFSTTLLGALIGVAIALSTPKKYEAITELLVDPRDLKLSDRNLTEQGLPSDATLAIVENQVRVLTSGTVLSKVVDRLNLDADPEFNGEQKAFGISAVIGELRSILSRGGDQADADHKTMLAIENLARALTVERGGKTFVITVGATTENPEKSALIANTMTDVFLETYGQIQSQTAGRAADELTSRLDELRKGVEAAERKVAAFKAENDIVDPQGRLITDDEIIKLNDQLSTARARTLELSARAASVRDVDVDSVVAGSIPESINSSIITELRSQYAALKNETDRMAVRLGPRHPQLQAAQAQLAGAREQIAGELRRIASSVQVEMKRAVELEQQLAKRLAQLKVRQGDLSGELVQLRELEREASTKRAVYESYLLRARETGEQRDINTANMSVISKAYPPLDPTGPSRSVIALTGAFLGFASGMGFAMMAGAYDSLRERREMQRRRQRRLPRHPDDSGPGRASRAPRDAADAPETGSASPAAARPQPVYPRYAEPTPTSAAHAPATTGHAYATQSDPRWEQEEWRPQPARVAYAGPEHTHVDQQSRAYAQPSQSYALQSYPQQRPSAQAIPFPDRQVQAADARGPASPTLTDQETSEAIADIRASLAEFREAMREFSAGRQKRRFF